MSLSKDILEVLACPKCKGTLKYNKKKNKLICKNCRLKFPVLKGDIPDMLIEDAKKY